MRSELLALGVTDLDLEPVDSGWLAGILEGEGCFTTSGSARRYIRIDLVSTDRDVVERAALLMDDSRVGVVGKTSTVSRKQQYRTTLSGARAARVMLTVLPQLGQRRAERVTGLLEQFVTHNGGRITSTTTPTTS